MGKNIHWNGENSVKITEIPHFAGFFVTLENIPFYMHWMSYVAYTRYGFEGTMLAVYGFDRETLKCSQPYCHFKYPQKFLEELSLDQARRLTFVFGGVFLKSAHCTCP